MSGHHVSRFPLEKISWPCGAVLRLDAPVSRYAEV